jgi:hypothetical protein
MWQYLGDHSLLFGWLGAISFATFVLSLLAVPIIIARLPADYFLKERPVTLEYRDRHPVIRWSFLILKNLLGVLLILGGIAMLVLPGQGVLTILIGLLLLNFPGKREVERWILKRSAVEKVVNWVRRKRGREPLLFPSATEQPRNVIPASPKQQT